MKKIFLFFALILALTSHPLLAQGVNMSKYITLTVKSGQLIELDFFAAQDNTPVRVVSGRNTKNFTAGTEWYYFDYTVTSDGSTMTIYGDIVGFSCGTNQANLTAINLSKNTQLNHLECYYNNISYLDVSKCTQLIYLDCENNNISYLDVSNNTKLKILDCKNNKLSYLDVSNNTKLKILYCENNNISSLDVSKCTNLEKLQCDNNKLTSLDVSKCTNLERLDCVRNKLTSLDVSKNTKLGRLYCARNKLTSLDVSKNKILFYIYCYFNPFTTEELNKLYCSLPERLADRKGICCPLYDKDDPNHSKFIAATSNNARNKNWDVKYYRSGINVPSNGDYDCNNSLVDMSKYITLEVESGKPINLGFKAAQKNTFVQVKSGNIIKLINLGTEWHYGTFTSDGTVMKISGNITQFDCKMNKEAVKYIYAGNNTQLSYLDCSDNKILNLDVSKNTKLFHLDCSKNSISTLDVSNNTQLSHLGCSNNKIYNLDVSKNTKLFHLDCSDNKILNLDLSKCTELEVLDCSKNVLYSIFDVDKNKKLTKLDCSKNRISHIDLSKNTKLTELDCDKNEFYYLDVSKNTKLTELDCSENNIFNLDLSKNKELTELICAKNKLSYIDISANKKLKRIICFGNHFSTIAMNVFYCSLPERPKDSKGECIPLWRKNDVNHDTIVAATSDIARNKNWNVTYLPSKFGGITPNVPSNGEYDCSANQLDKSKYITLNVKSGESIRLDFKARKVGTPVQVKSGNSTQNIVAGTEWLNKANTLCIATSDGTTMTIYGDIIGFWCKGNQENITAIDLSNNNQLSELNCCGNSISSLNVSNSEELSDLDCSLNSISSLDVSKNTKLTSLLCFNNNISSLDVSNNIELNTIMCDSNKIQSLDLSKNTKLKLLTLSLNPFTTESMNKTYCSLPERPKDEEGYCIPISKKTDYNHEIIEAATSDNARKKNWNVIYFESLIKPKLEDIPNNGEYDCSANDFDMSKYITLNVKRGENIKLDFKAAYEDTKVRIKNGNDTKDIVVGTSWYDGNNPSNFTVKADDSELIIYGDITEFRCNNNYDNLSSADLRKCPNLITLICYNNTISKLNISNNTRLRELVCSNNKLTSLDISKNNNLSILVCSDNEIETLITGEHYELSTLNITNNKLAMLDISKCPSLIRLYANNNNLKNLDLSKNTDLAYLFIAENKLTNLELSACTEIKKLYVNDNELSTLDLDKNTELITIVANNNKIQSLNISKTINLEELNISTNQLNELALSANTELAQLYCSENKINSLNLEDNHKLRYVVCYANAFTTNSIDLLYCSLPENEADTNNRIFVLFNEKDPHKEIVKASNSSNAKSKKWSPLFFEGYTDKEIEVTTTGTFDCNSGIDDNLAYGISVYPNPATNKVQVQLDESVNETLILVDLTGRAVLLEDVVAGKANIDVSNLSAGTYLIKVGNRVKKLTVK